MSLAVSSGVPGMGTAPNRTKPSIAIHHCGTRGKMISTRSPRASQTVEQTRGAPGVFRKLGEGQFLFAVSALLDAPQRQGFRPFPRPAIHDVLGEIEVRWRFFAHAKT